jgi:hypothetical protein
MGFEEDNKAAWQIFMANEWMRAVQAWLRIARRYPDHAADAYERVASCYFNMYNPAPRIGPAERIKARLLVERLAGKGYNWSRQYHVRPSYRPAAAWLYKAIATNSNHVESLQQLARYLPEGSDEARRFKERAHQAALAEGRRPPDDPRDVAGWDRFWRYRIDGERPYGMKFHEEVTETLVVRLRELGLRTILCVGNGISLEPRALAHAGFQVTALEISPVATAFARDFAHFDEYLAHFFPKRDLAEPGSSVVYESGDFMDPSICPRPYDVVMARRVVQCFPDEQRDQAMQAIIARLAPQGVFISHDHNAGYVTEPWLREHGFHISQGWHESAIRADPDGGFLAPPPAKRAAWVLMSSGIG